MEYIWVDGIPETNIDVLEICCSGLLELDEVVDFWMVYLPRDHRFRRRVFLPPANGDGADFSGGNSAKLRQDYNRNCGYCLQYTVPHSALLSLQIRRLSLAQ